MFKYWPYVSFKKLFNIFKIWFSYYISKWLKKPILLGNPFSVSIEPTTACNLKCPECPSGLRSFTRPTGNLNMDNFKKFIETNHANIMHLTFYFQGEPFIHKQFLEMVRMSHNYNIFTVTSTNAHFINDDTAQNIIQSGLDELIISLDGVTQYVYEQYRIEGSLSKVLQGTEKMVNWRKKMNSKKPRLIFQFLVVKPNEHQIEEAKVLAQKYEVDEIKFKTAQIYNYHNGHELIPSIEKYSRYRRLSNGTYKIKNELNNQCWKMWHSLVITWDGKAVPCCFDKDAKYTMGNVFTDSLSKVWRNELYQTFRKNLLKGRKNIDICQNCSEGTKVWS